MRTISEVEPDNVMTEISSVASDRQSVLSVQDLKVVFSGFKALKGVDLEVGENEIVTIIGPNGAGKSTLLDAIVGKSPVASGHVFYHGKDITNMSPYEVARMGIGRKFQNPNV